MVMPASRRIIASRPQLGAVLWSFAPKTQSRYLQKRSRKIGAKTVERARAIHHQAEHLKPAPVNQGFTRASAAAIS
jgi:hypothetical protein